MQDELLKQQIALTLIPGIGPVLAKNLISYCGSIDRIFKEKRRHLEKIPGIGSVLADIILKHDEFERAEKEVEFIRKYKISALFYTDDNYPSRLKHCQDSPVLLFYKGNADFNVQKVAGIVGTRKATDAGKELCEQFAADMKDKGIVVISGLAYGIDIAAHKASLKNNIPTIAILGHGLDRIYPAHHKSVAEKMIGCGGLLTEFISGIKPDKENFPMRNRILAGMVDALIVVEAVKTGGALITAEIANSYNRDVFAVPGRPGDVYSQGCNMLIKTNKAVLAESYADIEYLMGWRDESKKNELSRQKKLFVELDDDEKIITDILNKNESSPIDFLCREAAMPASKVAMLLLQLEFKCVIRSLPGKIYQLV